MKLDLDNPHPEARLAVELYERADKERREWEYSARALSAKLADTIAERDALAAQCAELQNAHVQEAVNGESLPMVKLARDATLMAMDEMEIEMDALRARLAIVEPVYVAAVRWRKCDEEARDCQGHDDFWEAVADAIDASLAAKPEGGHE